MSRDASTRWRIGFAHWFCSPRDVACVTLMFPFYFVPGGGSVEQVSVFEAKKQKFTLADPWTGSFFLSALATVNEIHVGKFFQNFFNFIFGGSLFVPSFPLHFVVPNLIDGLL